MDAARTAKRLGAEEALIVYRSRPRTHAGPAFEADEAIEEGIKIKWLTSIKEIDRPRPDGRDDGARRRRPADSPPASSKRSRPMRSYWRSARRPTAAFCARYPGIEFAARRRGDGRPDMMTGYPGIFAGGDMVPSERTVTVAVGHGKQAARHIDAWLRGERYQPPAKHPLVSFDMLHLPVYSDAEPIRPKSLPVRRSASAGSTEVVAGLSATAGALRGPALPFLRQLLRVRQLLCGLSGAGDRQSSGRACGYRSTMRTAPAAPSASSSAPATRSRWSPNQQGSERHMR